MVIQLVVRGNKDLIWLRAFPVLEQSMFVSERKRVSDENLLRLIVPTNCNKGQGAEKVPLSRVNPSLHYHLFPCMAKTKLATRARTVRGGVWCRWQASTISAGTKAGFAINRINRSESEMSSEYSFITAVKEGEEAIEFGPDAELVDYGDGWKLQAVQELKVVKSVGFGVEAKANDETKNVSPPVRKDFDPADFYPGGKLPEYSPPKDGWAYFWNISTLIGIIFAMIAIWVYLLESQFFLKA